METQAQLIALHLNETTFGIDDAFITIQRLISC